MSKTKTRRSQKKRPLSRERILAAAEKLADRGGLEALSMRQVGQALGVEAMSLYNHVKNKDDLLDGLVDRIIEQIDLDVLKDSWKSAMQKRACTMRELLLRHPWAIGLIESRENPGPATLRYHNAVLECLRTNGFSVQLAGYAFSTLDAYIYGFALQETSLPFSNQEEIEELGNEILENNPAEDYPYLTETFTQRVLQPGFSMENDFLFGLEILLDGLEQKL